MTVLIGIPTHRRPKLLRDCLQSLSAQTFDDIRIFVADNDASRREGFNVVERMAASFPFPLRAKVVEEPGISAVRNAILDEARTSGVAFVAMIDDDETASAGWISGLVSAQQKTEAEIVGGPVQYMFESPPSAAVLNSGMFQRPARPTGETRMLSAGGNFLVSAQALARSGWPMFDPQFGLAGGGDLDWFTRLFRLGLRFGWAADAPVYEHVPSERTEPRWILRRAYRLGNADMRISMKEWPSRRIFTSFLKLALTLGTAPVVAPLLALPERRVWVLARWSRAAGRIGALVGSVYQEYAERHHDNSGRHER